MIYPFSFWKKNSVNFITNGLILWYKLWNQNSGTSVIDASGNNYTLSLVNSPTWITGGINAGYTLSLNGTNQYGTSICPAQLGDFSYTAWIYTTSTEGVYTIFGGNAGFGFPQFRIDNTFLRFVSSCIIGLSESTGQVSSGSWYHVCLTWSSSLGIYTFYINGVSSGSGTIGPVIFTSQNTYISLNGCDDGVEEFQGNLNDLRIYNRVLSSTEITRIYNLNG